MGALNRIIIAESKRIDRGKNVSLFLFCVIKIVMRKTTCTRTRKNSERSV